MGEAAFDEPFCISVCTLNELENIKTNHNKDDSVRYKARQMAKLLDQHRTDGSYTLEWECFDQLQQIKIDTNSVTVSKPAVPNTVDSEICAIAKQV